MTPCASAPPRLNSKIPGSNAPGPHRAPSRAHHRLGRHSHRRVRLCRAGCDDRPRKPRLSPGLTDFPLDSGQRAMRIAIPAPPLPLNRRESHRTTIRGLCGQGAVRTSRDDSRPATSRPGNTTSAARPCTREASRRSTGTSFIGRQARSIPRPVIWLISFIAVLRARLHRCESSRRHPSTAWSCRPRHWVPPRGSPQGMGSLNYTSGYKNHNFAFHGQQRAASSEDSPRRLCEGVGEGYVFFINSGNGAALGRFRSCFRAIC